ncbi:MAG: hypothetical protein AAF682_11835 [Planctomycetota bacterium]
MPLQPDDDLFIPSWRRLLHEERPCGRNRTALYLYYSNKELCFDEPWLVPFARGLLTHERFRAGSTRTWADGEPYAWSTVRELLETLVEEGIVRHAGDDAPPAQDATLAPRSSTGGPGVEPVDAPDTTRCWSRAHDRCAELGAGVFGVPFDLNQLEFFLPVFRVAHPAIDTEGRQVGEANVRAELLQPIRTEWRVCRYPGSRFEAGLMNVTALSSMRTHWETSLAWIAALRSGFVRRYPQEADGMSVGGLYLLSCAVLALPAYTLMRPRAPLRGGEVDACLAAMFRIADGVRFATEGRMVGVADWTPEATPGERVDADAFLRYVERTELYHTKGRVCAGPTNLIRELLEVMLTGKSPARSLPDVAGSRADLERCVGDLERALAYFDEAILLYLQRRWFELHTWEPVQALRDELAERGGAAEAQGRELDEWLAEVRRGVQTVSAPAGRAAVAELAAQVRARVPGSPELPPLAGAPSAGAGGGSAADQAQAAAARMETLHLDAAAAVQERINLVLRRSPARARPFGPADLAAATARPLASEVLARGRGGRPVAARDVRG